MASLVIPAAGAAVVTGPARAGAAVKLSAAVAMTAAQIVGFLILISPGTGGRKRVVAGTRPMSVSIRRR
jgi:hypothetical protein